MLAFAMFALSQVLSAILATYSYWVMKAYGFRTGDLMLKGYDFMLRGYLGILFVAPLTCIILVVSLHLFLTRVKFGIAMRAAAEDPELTSSLGVNIFRIHLTSWFLTGAMAALAGAALPLWLPTRLGGSDALLVSIIAGSVLGGLDNIYGAIVGGFAIALAQRVLPSILIRAFGVWIGGYDPMVPIIVIVAILLTAPKGITNILNK
jgi:branched-chain amino acid transport system permease protein